MRKERGKERREMGIRKRKRERETEGRDTETDFYLAVIDSPHMKEKGILWGGALELVLLLRSTVLSMVADTAL